MHLSAILLKHTMARFRLPKPLRFSLRTLLLAVTAASLYLGWEWRFVHEQQAVNQMLEHRSSEREQRRLPDSRYQYAIVRWKSPSDYSGLRRLMGARPYPIRCFDGYFTKDEIARIRGAYPDMIVDHFDDDSSSDSTT
jgi:hypothetical protein